MSISKVQAEALAEGFLDTIGGGDADNINPRSTFTELILIAGEFIESAQKNLIASNRNASGNLSASLVANEPTLEGKTLRIDIEMNYYGLFVNSGVKGTRGGSSTGGYSFKHDLPSKDMVAEINKWIDLGKISVRNVKKSYGKREGKQVTISQLDSAYAVARSIKMKGLKGTGFIDKAVKSTEDKVGSRLGAALVIDLHNSLTGEKLK